MIRKLSLLLALLILSGCAGVFIGNLHGLKGHDANAAYRQYGEPTHTYIMPNGNQVLVWERGEHKIAPEAAIANALGAMADSQNHTSSPRYPVIHLYSCLWSVEIDQKTQLVIHTRSDEDCDENG